MKKILITMLGLMILFTNVALSKSTWVPIIIEDITTFVKSKSNNNIISNISVQITNDTLTFTIKGNFDSNSHYSIFIDSDNNPNTGYSKSKWHMRGIDYLLQGYALYKHRGDGNHWDKIGDIRYHTTSTQTTLSIDKDTLPLNATIKYTGVVTSHDWNKDYPFGKMNQVNVGESDLLPIVIIGPSTVQGDYGYSKTYHKDGSQCPIIIGWGEVFNNFAKNASIVYNYARAGASAGSFREPPHEGWADEVHEDIGQTKPYNILFGPNRDRYWTKTKEKIQELNRGILLIQFGGNDANHLATEFPTHVDNDIDKPLIDYNKDGVRDGEDVNIAWNLRYDKFQDNLKFYIDEAKDMHFIPILITSPNGRFITNGKVINSRGDYPTIMKKLATKEGIEVLDFHQKTMKEYESYGSEKALDRAFDACYISQHNPSDNNKDRNHFYNLNRANMAAGWIKDLACKNSNSLLCKQLEH